MDYSDLPRSGTFWLVCSNGLKIPMPCPPTDPTTPVYALDLVDNIYLVDGTKGQVAVNHGQTAEATVTAQANGVVDLISQVQENAWERMMVAVLGGEESATPQNFTSLTSVDYNTNRLFLEISNVANGLVYLNLHNATNPVYAIWSTTDLLTPWQVATELWPVDTNYQPFTLHMAGRQNLFLRAEDWTEADSNSDGLPDWWSWYWFGNLNASATNLDDLGNTFAYDFAMGLDPNVISFTVRLGNQNFNTLNATGSFLVVSGLPNYEAVLVNDTNFDHAVWTAYDGVVHLNLGPTDGAYQIWFGLKGHSPEATPTWIGTTVYLDRAAPQIVITSPTTNLTAAPCLQVQGFAEQELQSITYDLSNAVTVVAGQPGLVTGYFVDTNLADITTNYFQCYDVLLTDGLNLITVHATDLAGNTTVTNLQVTLDYSTAVNPSVKLLWPQDNLELCGSNFTVRGWTEDAAAQVSAIITDSNGDTNTIAGVVERTGKLWVQNLPLNSGTNWIALSVTNTAGLSSTTNFSVVKSDMTLTLTSIDGELWLPTVNVSGVISSTNAPVWVNGIQGTNHGDGTWNATNVPVSAGGVASFEMSTIPPGQADPSAIYNAMKPDELKLEVAKWHRYQLQGQYGSQEGHELYDEIGTFSIQTGGNIHYYYERHNSLIYPDTTNIYDTPLTTAQTALPPSSNPYYYDIPEETGLMNWAAPSIPEWGEMDIKVKMMFHLGGIAKAGLDVLVAGTASALETWPIQIGILATNIMDGQIGQLDDTGWATTVVAEGATVNATPQTGAPYYGHRTGPSAYRLVHLTHCPALTDTNLARLNIGVGEYVDLSGMPGNTVWTGPGLPPTTNSMVTFTAPSNADPSGTKVTVTATVPNSATLTVDFTVFPPSGYDQTHTCITSTFTNAYPPGFGGAAMKLNVYIAPTSVSFYRVQIMEVGENATNNTGFWAYDASPNYYSTNDLRHGTADAWTTPLNSDNSLPNGDTCGTPAFLPPWAGGGGMTWPIPAKWKVGNNGTTNDLSGWSNQVFFMDASGTVSITKFGQTVTRTVNNVVNPPL